MWTALNMQVIFCIEIFFLSFVSGYLPSEDLKFCVFAGDFETSVLTRGIKKRSEKMFSSAVVDVEQLDILTVPSKTLIITSKKIFTTISSLAKRRDLLWVTMPLLKNSSNFVSLESISHLVQRKDVCKPEILLGVNTEKGICDNMMGKDVFAKVDCYHYQIMGMLAPRFNFTTKTIELEDKRYPYIFPNGTHSGLFRMVEDQHVDVCCGGVVVTAPRILMYDWLWPTFYLDTMLYLKREQHQNPWSSFSKPFENDVWAAILLYVLSSGLISHILHVFFFNFKITITGFYKSFLSSLKIFCNQAPEDVPKRLPIRLVHYLSLVAIVVLYPVYSGSIVSFLTVNIPFYPFRDFDGFLADQRYSLLTWEGDFLTYYFYFEVGDKAPVKNLLVGTNNIAKDVKEGMERLCHKNFIAYADSKQNLADVMEAVECDILEVPKRILVFYMGMMIDGNLPCRDHLSSGIRYLHSTGIIKKMQLELVPPLAFMKLKAIKEGYSSIALKKIYPCLVLLVIGLLAGMLIFLLEVYFRNQVFKKERRKT